MRIPGQNPANPALADAQYHEAFEAERARILRRRIVWSCGVLLVLLGVSFLGTIAEFREYRRGEIPWLVLALGVLQDVSLASIALATLGYVLGIKPDRERLVRLITVSTIAMTTLGAYFDIRRSGLHPTDLFGNNAATGDPVRSSCVFGLFATAIIITLPLVLIPMRLAESARIALGCWVAYVLLIVLVTGAGPVMASEYALYSLLLTIPPVLYSHWRYTRFDAAFEHRELKGRYQELSAELSQARKLHDALLPPRSIGTNGPLRIGYVYEPMREIGGDFVFIWPMDDDADAIGNRPTYVVLIDVAGHGVGAALAVNRLHGELTRLFGLMGQDRAARPPTAGEVIEALNAYVYLTLSSQGVFATGICLRIDRLDAPTLDRGSTFVEWASAGHPPALLRSSSQDASLHQLGATATMLGVIEPLAFEAQARRLPLVPGDSIIAYTDGLHETRIGEGRELGIEHVERVVRDGPSGKTIADAGPTALAAALLRTASEHRVGRVTDDTLIVEISIVQPLPTEAPLQPGATRGSRIDRS